MALGVGQYADLRFAVGMRVPEYMENEDIDKVKDITEQLEDEKRKNSTNLSDTKSDSRPNTKDSKAKKKGKGAASDNEEEEDTEKSRPSSHKSLEQVTEEVMAFDYSYDLDAEEMWADLPPNHVLGRFTQFRELARARISELEEQLSDTTQKTQRKVNTLKGQFQEHKSKWESERNVLIEQIDQLQKLQNVAEKEADVAMAQLEDFINEQEELEIAEEEEHKSRASTTPAPPVVTTPDVGEQPENLQEVTEEPEEEKLLEQTDDAKGKHGKATPSSRETIRSKYRESLEETRSAIAERRSKSPALSLKSMKSSLDDMELDENGDMPFPEDKTFADIGTSPMTQKDDGTSSSRKSLTLAKHPVVQEYLKTYDTVIAFKDTLGKILAEKDMTSASQLLTEMEPYAFNMAEKVQPQVEEMTRNVVQIFEEMLQLLSGVILSKGPYSVDGAPERSFLTKTDTGLAPSRISRHSNDSSIGDVKTAAQIKDLQEQLIKLEMVMGSQKQQYEEKLNHNTVVMMEMQDTINGLRREMSNIGIQTRTPSAAAPLQPVGSPIMFTRLDSERNSKVLKKAVMSKKLETKKYQAAVEKMDEYINIPAQRLAHLVRKYTHHCQMKAIEANVRLSRSLNDEVFYILDKMEQLQNRRAQKWAEKMDVMGSDRLRLAQLLMEVLDDIEMESGIFLIKPMYSFKGREYLNLYANRQSRAHTQKFRTVSPLPTGSTNASSRAFGVAPAPTPASQLKHDREMENMTREEVGKMYTRKTDDGISGASLGWVTGEKTGGMWSASVSQPKTLTDDNLLFQSSILNTPRILELDVNRMMIGQNQISAKMRGSLGDDRLMNAAQTNLRNYVTVTRPTNSTTPRKDRPTSGSTNVPPTTPYIDRKGSGDGPRATLPRDTVPLPPISPTILKEKTGTKVKFEDPKPPAPVPPDPSQ